MLNLESSSARLSILPDPPDPPGRAMRHLAFVSAGQADWRLAALDEVDYGMLLVRGDAEVVHCNYAAHLELREAHPLSVTRGELRARDPHDDAALQAALRNATGRGLRKLLTVGQGAERLGIALVPLADQLQESAGHALVTLGKRKVCEQLSIQAFASAHGLTAAETRVLVRLCGGHDPAGIASQLSVAISTVRTQIWNIRMKTGASTIRALLQQIASLPPLMGTLRARHAPVCQEG